MKHHDSKSQSSTKRCPQRRVNLFFKSPPVDSDIQLFQNHWSSLSGLKSDLNLNPFSLKYVMGVKLLSLSELPVPTSKDCCKDIKIYIKCLWQRLQRVRAHVIAVFILSYIHVANINYIATKYWGPILFLSDTKYLILGSCPWVVHILWGSQQFFRKYDERFLNWCAIYKAKIIIKSWFYGSFSLERLTIMVRKSLEKHIVMYLWLKHKSFQGF